MRVAAVVLALVASAAAMAHGIFDEFAAGFGGVPWGIDFPALLAQFPGGYEDFSTAPGGVAYALNIDDPVLGIARRGQHVTYGIGTDGKVEFIQIQVPYDQTSVLISTLTSSLGPAKSLEVRGVVTSYLWPNARGMALSVRTTNNRAYGLTALTIHNPPRIAAKPSGGRPG